MTHLLFTKNLNLNKRIKWKSSKKTFVFGTFPWQKDFVVFATSNLVFAFKLHLNKEIKMSSKKELLKKIKWEIELFVKHYCDFVF